MHKLIAVGLLGGAVLLIGLPAGADVVQHSWVVAGGGGYVANASFNHWCTVGQAAVGVVSNATHTHSIGFWYTTFPEFSDVPESPETPPTAFALSLGAGNPAGATASLVYAVPVAGQVRIGLYDVAGREVARVVDGHVEPGYHRANLRAGELGAGIYFCRMEARGFADTRKLVLLR
jgi:hypothetical protein